MPSEPVAARPRWVDIGVLIAATPIVLAAARILIFSGGDPALFRVLIQTLNVPTVLLGTIVSILPVVALLPLALFASEPGALWHFTRARWFRYAFPAYSAVVVAAITLGPWPAMGWTALTVTLLFVVFRLARRAQHGTRAYRRGLTMRSAIRASPPMRVRAPSGAWKSSALSPIAIVILSLASLQSMWLPSELLHLADGTELTGFVLEEKSEWTTFLTEGRAILRVSTAQVEARTVCQQGEFSSLMTHWAKISPVNAPRC